AKPEGNKQIGKFHKCENLRNRFGAEVRSLMREELYGVLGRTIAIKDTRKADKSNNQPVLAPYMNGKPKRLKARYKGKLYRAMARKTGAIRVDRKIFNSP